MGKSSIDIKFVIIDETSYSRILNESFKQESIDGIIGKEEIEKEFAQFNTMLLQALSEHWCNDSDSDNHDFEIMDEWDWHGTFFHGGGIYSERIHCPKYIKTIIDVISRLNHSKQWIYHTVCEADEGEFFIRNREVYVPKDGHNYIEFFGTPNSTIEHFQSDDPVVHIREAVLDKDKELVIELLKQTPDLVNSRDECEDTPLHHAVESDQLEMSNLLIKRGADINSQNVLGWSPLHVACNDCCGLETIDLLLKSGANVNLATEDKCVTPLHIAASCGLTKVAQTLIDAGANVNNVIRGKNSPLHAAALFDKFEIAALLIKNGADVNCRGERGFTPLHRCAFQGSYYVCELLLSAGADVNIVDESGKSPLWYSQYKDHKSIEWLIQKYKG